jgi:hypothetical protein
MWSARFKYMGIFNIPKYDDLFLIRLVDFALIATVNEPTIYTNDN